MAAATQDPPATMTSARFGSENNNYDTKRFLAR